MFCYQLQSDLLNLGNAKTDNNLQYLAALKFWYRFMVALNLQMHWSRTKIRNWLTIWGPLPLN